MKEYKSSLFVIAKNVVYGVGGGFVAALILNIFLSTTVATILGVIAGLFIIYFAVVGDNIKVVIDGDDMSVYRLGVFRYGFKISECGFYAKVVTTSDMTGGDSDCDLTVTEADGKETCIDCSMLGRTRFMELLEDLGVTNAEPVKLAVTRKAESE